GADSAATFQFCSSAGARAGCDGALRLMQETNMRILSMMRATKETEAGIPPGKELIERMGALVEEATKAGVLLSSDGLHPSSKGKRLKLENGKITVIDGPFTESRELVASYALCQVK